MDAMMKGAAVALIAAILGIILQRQGKEYALVLFLAVSVGGICLALGYLEPVFSFVEQLRLVGQLDSKMMEILIKAVGIGMISEIVGAICSDTGNASLGKMLQILSVSLILWISLPILEQIMDLIQEVLEGI